MSIKRAPQPIERLTTWVGSVPSLIVHTVVFTFAFALGVFGLAPWDSVLLVVTTIVSLEAIYLAIFIQMSVNRAQVSLSEVEADVAEIEENIEGISEDIEGIEKDVADIEENIEDISEDIEGIEKDVAEIEENIDEVTEDIEELQEDIDELSEEESKDGIRKKKQEVTLSEIAATLGQLIADIETLKKR